MSETKEKPAWHGIPRKEIPWYPTVDQETCIGCQLCYVTCGRAGLRNARCPRDPCRPV